MSGRLTRGARAEEAKLIGSEKENNIPHFLSSPPSTRSPTKSTPKPKSTGTKVGGKKKDSKVKQDDEDTPTELPTPKTNGKKSKGKVEPTVKVESDAPLKQEDAEPKQISNVGKKRKRSMKEEAEGGHQEVSHNMGSVPEAEIEEEDAEMEGKIPIKKPALKAKTTTPAQSNSKTIKDEKDALRAVLQLAKVKAKIAEEAEKRQKAVESGRKTKSETYGLMEGETPFPRWEHPRAEECQAVHDILLKHHTNVHPQPKTIADPSQFVAGCGEVRSILDALIRTRLSASTTGRNSNAAYQGMVRRYGLLKSGVGKGSVDYDAVRKAPVQDLFYAIQNGGLAVSKSADIKALLDVVYEMNQARRQKLLDAKAKNDRGPKGVEMENKEQVAAEIKLAEDGNLSLDHFYTLPTYDAIYQFMTFPGIGVKTAACVAMFCMQRPCFAVDTHVFRLAKWLGWVPPTDEKIKGDKTVDRDTTFSHLEVRVPDHLKYMLHQLFLAHGKTCPRCRGNTGESSEGWAKGCVIDHLVQRSGPRKGGDTPVKARSTPKKGKKAAFSDEEDLDEAMPDLDDDDEEPEMPDLDDQEEDEDAEEDDGSDFEASAKSKSRTKSTPSRTPRSKRAPPVAVASVEKAAQAQKPVVSAKKKKRKTPPKNGWKGGKAVNSREASTDG